MSAGPGHVMRGIGASIDANPGRGFTVDELCRHVYSTEQVVKKHRVAVIRAMRGFANRRRGMIVTHGHQFGRPGNRPCLVLVDLANIEAIVADLRDRDIWLYRDRESLNAIAGRYEAERPIL